MRETLGPDFGLLIEVHRRLAPMHAIRIGQRLVELGIDWYEEPCLADNLALLAEVRRAVPIPIVTGEALLYQGGVGAAIWRACRRHPQPRHLRGGITAMMDIAAMAQPQAVVMSPHNYNSPLIGMAATVHVSAVIPNFRITEYFVNFTGCALRCHRLSISQRRLDRPPPSTPSGLIDIDVERLRAHPHQEATKHGFRQYWEEYPRKGYVPSSGRLETCHCRRNETISTKCI